MVKLKYRKYGFMSNWGGAYNIMWWGIKVDFADIPWQKPNITEVAIN
jgi:hypothetical protein